MNQVKGSGRRLSWSPDWATANSLHEILELLVT